MIKFLTPAWKIAQQRLQQIHFYNNNYLKRAKLQDIQSLIIQDVKSSRKLTAYLKSMKKNSPNPQNLINYAIFIHAYLQNACQINENAIIDFLNYLLKQCQIIASIYNETDIARKSDVVKCKQNQSRMSTRQDQPILCKEDFIVSNVIKPYISYLFKVVSTLSQEKCPKYMKSQQSSWATINLLHSMTNFTKSFTTIGRYFIKDYGALIVLLIQSISKDIINNIEDLRTYVRQQNYILSCSSNLTIEDQSKILEFIYLLDQITVVNENLNPVYFGKYFFEYLTHLTFPNWINPDSSQFDAIFKIAEHFTTKNKLQNHSSR